MSFSEEALGAFRRGDTDLVERLSRREAARAREDGDVAARIEALGMLARVAVRRGDVPEARRLATQAMTLARRSGRREWERTPAHLLAGSARVLGDLDAARVLYAESIALNEALGETRMVAVEQHNLGHVELRAGDLGKARSLFASARRGTLRGGHEDMFVYVALDVAVMAAADGDPVLATRWTAAIDGALAEHDQILDPDDAVEQTRLRERLLDELGPAAYEAAYATGAGLDLRRLLTG